MSCDYGAQGVSSPAMSGPYTFSNYGTCSSAAGCGAPKGLAMTNAQRQQALSTMAANGTLTYGSMGKDAYGLSSALPSGAACLTKSSAKYAANKYGDPMVPASQPEMGNSRIPGGLESGGLSPGASVTAGMSSQGVLYDWRRNAWRYQPGMVYREWTDRQRAAVGIDDPWGNQSARQFKLDESQGWAGLVNLSGTTAVGVLPGSINYAGKPLATEQQCSPKTNQSMFQQGCVPSPQAYGSYKQYGMEPDFFRSTPFSVAYSSPNLNPQAFTVSASLPQSATPQQCISQTQ
jgi:hypothetical protein